MKPDRNHIRTTRVISTDSTETSWLRPSLDTYPHGYCVQAKWQVAANRYDRSWQWTNMAEWLKVSREWIVVDGLST